MDQKRKIQILGILLFAFALMHFVSLAGHTVSDDEQITSDEAIYGNPFSLGYSNPGGMMGAYLSYISLFFFGWTAYFFAIFLAVLGLKITGLDLARRLLKHAVMVWILVIQVLIAFKISDVASNRVTLVVPYGAGELGRLLIELMVKVVGVVGAYILVISAVVCTLFFYGSISHRFRNGMVIVGNTISAWSKEVWQRSKPMFAAIKEFFTIRIGGAGSAGFGTELKKAVKKRRKRKTDAGPETGEDDLDEDAGDDVVVVDSTSSPDSSKSRSRRIVVLAGKPETNSKSDTNSGTETAGEAEAGLFVSPGLDILAEPATPDSAYDEKELAETAKSLRDTLETFGVRLSGNIEMFPGPVITRFEIKPAAGVKVSQIANLSEDLALNLRAKSIRIVAPIPGKAAVGIEIPNRNPQMVYLREVLSSEKYQNHTFALPLALGKDIAGKPYVTDLTEMPHLLIAGTTGSGKSVCINVIITSLIYSMHPEQLRFIFVDPKMLELSVYKGIPYLDENVVTNPKQAERVLNDIVTEMELRYKLLAGASVRSIIDYNDKQRAADKKLPYIVIIIDELADLMMSAQSSRVELLITRLAQMARAVGIHLILATQRPSVDVITGLIKANFPSRVAFQVATKTDSRTILDGNGAERLLGRGDMLFLESGSPDPMRLHGPLISSGETEKLVSFLKNQSYSKAREEEAHIVAEEKAQMRQLNDPVMLEAIETVIRQGQASVSLLQRKLGIGYQRAARLIDDLEEMKIIGEYNESKARDVLVDQAFLDNIKNGKISKL